MAAVSQICCIITLSICMKLCAPTSYMESGYGNNQFNDKTAYFWTYPKQISVSDSLNTTLLDGRKCHVVHVNVVSRHGARYTSAKDMRSFTALKQKLQGTFTNGKYDFINTWTNKYPENEAELLTALGKEEMFYIGSVFGTELHSFLRDTVSSNGSLNSLKFSSTRKTRTQESADWFFRGLTNDLIGLNVTNFKADVRDDILRFYDDCKRYERDTSDLNEVTKFENGAAFQTMIEGIKDRMGTNISLTIDDVKMMHRLCATELAVMNNADWCTLQTDGDREILEYDDDILDYIIRLYGHTVTQQMSCPLAQDVFTGMDRAIKAYDEGSSYTKGVFQFGHADTVIDFAGALGLFNDTKPINSDNFASMQNRKFRSSRVDPFSTHLTFILYNCIGSGADNYALRLMLNGKALTIPACGSDTCWYQDVRQAYQHYIDHCDWQRVCSLQDGAPVVG